VAARGDFDASRETPQAERSRSVTKMALSDMTGDRLMGTYESLRTERESREKWCLRFPANWARRVEALHIGNSKVQVDDALPFKFYQDRLRMLSFYSMLKTHLHDLEFIGEATSPKEVFQLFLKNRNFAWSHLRKREKRFARQQVLAVDIVSFPESETD
jgi:hypothetical protein